MTTNRDADMLTQRDAEHPGLPAETTAPTGSFG
jgi:hypothetical protein